MSSIDERVVAMKFDNAQFQKGVADTNSSLDSLKKGLNLDGAAKSLQGLDAAGKSFSLAGMASGVEAIASKFSALSVLGITALVNIGNQAVNTGLTLVKSLTIGPIADGFSDYNAKLTSVQTIMNATGASIGTVSGYFGQLDTYADKTIYNLTDMTGAFAKFTNAGVDMNKSVPAIKGIANMVALAGQDAGAASIAMYNLSQSIAGGFLTTTDYKSLNLANVATKEWKDQMVKAAVAAGSLEKVGDKYHIAGTKAGAASTAAELFNDNLADGWATTNVLMKVLGDYGNTNTAIGKKAQAAAQDVKSFSMMMDTLKAGVGTGWTDTFEILVGNLHEAKALFTPLTASVGGFLTSMGDARNRILGDWKKLGGRTALIDGIKHAFAALQKVVMTVSGAFRSIFPATTGKDLMNITTSFKNFAMALMPTPKTINAISRIAKGFFAALDIGRMIIVGVVKVIQRLLGEVSKGGGGILEFAANFGDMIVKFRESIIAGNGINLFFREVHTVLSNVIQKVKDAAEWFGNLFKGFENINTGGTIASIEHIEQKLHPLQAAGEHIGKVWGFLGDVFKNVWDFFAPMGKAMGDFFGTFTDKIKDSAGKIDFNLVLDAINTGLFAGLILLIKKFFKGGFQDAADGGGIIDHIKGVFSGMTDTLGQMQNTLKAGTLLAIAGAIALLSASAVALAGVDSGRLAAALGAMAVLFTELLAAMSVFEKINPNASVKNMIAIGIGMILLATAIRILVSSVEALSKLSWEELLKGLVGTTVLLGALAGAMKIMGPQSGKMISTGVGLMFVAVAIKILASAVRDFAEMDWQKMMQGLIGVGMVLGGLALFTRLAKVSKGSMASSAGLILLGVALKIIASAVSDFANMNVATLQQGLGSVTAILGALAIFSRVVNPAGMVAMGVSMVIIGGALKILATAITDLGNIPWDILGRGLVGMAGALTIIAIATRLMPSNMILTAVSLAIIAGSLKILAEVMKSMGGMSWEEIGKGMTVLAGSLLILAGAMYLMSGGIAGAAALLIMAAALTVFVPVLQSLGAMSWETIWTGIGALALSLLTLGLVGAVLGVLSPLFMLFGVSLMLIGAGALLAGTGILLFSAGITALAIAGAAGTAVLISMVTQLLGLIPLAMQKLGEGVIAFANVITNGAPAIAAAIMAVLTSLLNVINVMSPQIVDTLWHLVVLLVEALVRGIPYLVDAGMRLVIGILDGVGRNIGKITDSAAKLITNFIDGIARNLPSIIKSGANLVISFIEGLAKEIRDSSDRMSTAGLDLAGAIIDGMVNGVSKGIDRVAEAARNIATSALDTVKSWLGIKSPSREFHKLGAFSTEGFVRGILSLVSTVKTAAKSVGSTAIDAVKKSISGVSAAVAGDMDMTPTIRPVLDLSAIKKDSSLIGNMLTPPHLEIDGSYAKATALLASSRTNDESTSTGAANIEAERANIMFVQNNHSPKALSPADVYRQTRNQLSVAKGALATSRAN